MTCAGGQSNQTQCEMIPAGKENVSELPQPQLIKPSSTTLHQEQIVEVSTPGID